ncbi:MAG: hypothetical protein E6Q95_04235 [Chitinophagaceae bacterium]|nr:MAG: hypothetical protein E6Q95_04235 [Chitinophagaceae bacterium]
MSQPIYIIVNPHCHQGHGWKRWQLIKDEILNRLPGTKEIVTDKKEDIESFLKTLTTQEAIVISAGGDGGVHYLVNAVLKTKIADKIIIGAIGLGSSNDFLKPFKTYIRKIPVRIDIGSPWKYQDIGKANFIDENNKPGEKYFIINSSFGATAEGNWNFNNPGSILRWLKKYYASLAITYTGISTILSFKNKICTLNYNGETRVLPVSNINIIKKPFVSGSLHYQQNILPNDGQLGLNICTGMNKKELLKTMFDLEKGKFILGEKKISTFIKYFSLLSDSPVVFECDCETEKVTRVDISILPKAIRILKA